ncbi:LuxR C-terminal-related transcriptional regulator [Oceanobacillus kimchii]|uniref:sigma factor-like helix-turn-helix DNA-binding protein n=1 Tax=Oceanobacillus kimchii TaxID=746691 RepID=UPI0021A316B3|nr:sigma factor-like helix-turn-helix DNA-binding protein [Oceanobacillus kimchii]MCT1577962.1 LuxR C-terminal-related transcriptional regulator [Oceanobacillus kimchii]MCT2137522.1 LuxR C-terminal-related transcriptional regulator [Oceanobacillus kimchii]
MDTKQLENWADELLIEYEEGRKGLRTMADELNPDENPKDKEDKRQINSMITDMSYAMDWMRTGRRPGNLRGVDKRSAYQKRVLYDMELFPSLDIEPEERTLSEEEKKQLYDILIELSHRERQCYLLHMANGASMSEISNQLGITKSSVQTFIQRAKKKISCHPSVVRNRIEDERDVI